MTNTGRVIAIVMSLAIVMGLIALLVAQNFTHTLIQADHQPGAPAGLYPSPDILPFKVGDERQAWLTTNQRGALLSIMDYSVGVGNIELLDWDSGILKVLGKGRGCHTYPTLPATLPDGTTTTDGTNLQGISGVHIHGIKQTTATPAVTTWEARIRVNVTRTTEGTAVEVKPNVRHRKILDSTYTDIDITDADLDAISDDSNSGTVYTLTGLEAGQDYQVQVTLNAFADPLPSDTITQEFTTDYDYANRNNLSLETVWLKSGSGIGIIACSEGTDVEALALFEAKDDNTVAGDKLRVYEVNIAAADVPSTNIAPAFHWESAVLRVGYQAGYDAKVGFPVPAVDADDDDCITYTLSNVTLFEIDDDSDLDTVADPSDEDCGDADEESAGQIKLKKNVELVPGMSYPMVLSASDGNGGSDSIDLTVVAESPVVSYVHFDATSTLAGDFAFSVNVDYPRESTVDDSLYYRYRTTANNVGPTQVVATHDTSASGTDSVDTTGTVTEEFTYSFPGEWVSDDWPITVQTSSDESADGQYMASVDSSMFTAVISGREYQVEFSMDPSFPPERTQRLVATAP